MANEEGEARLRYCHIYSGEEVSTCPDEWVRLYTFTFKGAGTLSRVKIETEFEETQFKKICCRLPRDIRAFPIKKISYKYDINGYKIEISEIDDSWQCAEVEFSSGEEAMNYKFPGPNVVIKDVTFDNDYKMKNWIRTRGNKINV